MSASFVQAEKLRPTAFEVEYFDQYDFYSLTDRYSSKWAGRGGKRPENGVESIVGWEEEGEHGGAEARIYGDGWE